MKKAMCLVVGLGVLISFSSLVFAQEDMENRGGGDSQSEQGGGMMGGGRGGKGGKMMGMMNKDTLIATSDGGVVVMQGPRLIKYDSAMNLVKEVELPRGKKPGASEAKTEPVETGESATPQ